MALVLANRVQEQATANTTVSFTLTGAILGFQTFAVVGNGNTTYYSATDLSGNWEVGLGTYSTTGPTLTRTTVYASSNSGSAVTFSGTVTVFVTYPSGKSVNLDASDNVGIGTTTPGAKLDVVDSSSNDALRITQTGAGNAFLVEDSSPDSTPFVIDANGRTAIGSTTALTYSSSSSITPNLQVNAAGAATSGISRFSTNSSANAYWFLKSRGATTGAFDVVASGDTLGTIGWLGADGTDGIQAATIAAAVDGTPGQTAGTFTVGLSYRILSIGTTDFTLIGAASNTVGITFTATGAGTGTGTAILTTGDMPGRLVFSTTADGASSPTERMRIDNAGSVGIGVGGALSAGVSFQVNKNITGSTISYGIYSRGTIQSDVTSSAASYISWPATQAAAFTLGSLYHYRATQGTFGAGSTVTNQMGFYVDATPTGATNNYGFYGSISASSVTAGSFVVGTSYKITSIGTTDFTLIGASSNTVGTVFTATGAGTGTGTANVNGRWNFFANGTAENVFNGNTIISVSSGLDALRITQTGAGNALVVEDSTNPDSTPFVIDASGYVISGYTATVGTALNSGPRIDVVTNSANTGGGLGVARYRASTNLGADIELLKSASTTIGTAAAVASGETIGSVVWSAAGDTTNYYPAAQITAYCDGTPGSGIVPGRLEFATTPEYGASSPTRRMRLDKIGQQTQFGPLVVSNTLANDVTYDSKSFDVSTQEAGATGIAFRPDGKMMYILGTGGDDITYYSLSTAWDISTATFVSQSNSTTAQNGTPQGFCFKPDGTKVFIVGGTAPAGVWSYSCTSPWDVSTITYDSKTVDISAFTTGPSGIWFKPDGTKMYIASNTGATATYTDTVLEYTLTTAWDLNTAAFSTSYLSVAAQDTGPAGVQFTNDGMRMFVAGQTGDTVVVYDLSTAWDLSTASFAVETSNLQNFLSGATLNITDLYVEPNGQKLYIISDTGSGAGTNMVYQFTAFQPATINLTGDTTISGNTTVAQDLTVYGSAVFSGGNTLIGGTASRGTTVGTAHLDLFNGTAPAGTLTNGVSLYSSSGDFNFMDSAGNGYKVGFRNLPPVGTKTGSYTLAVGDVGKYVQVSTGGSITIPTSTFAEGDAITIANNTTGSITITCSAPTAYISGTNTVKTSMTLATRGVATVLFLSSTVCFVSGNVT